MVGKVAPTPSDPLLERPGIRGLFQSYLVVIRLEDEEMAAGQSRPDRRRCPSQVCRHPREQPALPLSNRDRHRIRGVMTCRNRVNLQAADPKPGLGGKELDGLLPAKESIAGFSRALGHEQRPAPATSGNTDPGRVISMLVRNDDRIDLLRSASEFGQPAREFRPAESGVYEDPGRARLDEHGVAAASTTESGNPQSDSSIRARSQQDPSHSRTCESASRPRRARTMAAVSRKRSRA